MGHKFYEDRRREDALAYRAHLRAELESFLRRERVMPRSHGRVLRVESADV